MRVSANWKETENTGTCEKKMASMELRQKRLEHTPPNRTGVKLQDTIKIKKVNVAVNTIPAHTHDVSVQQACVKTSQKNACIEACTYQWKLSTDKYIQTNVTYTRNADLHTQTDEPYNTTEAGMQTTGTSMNMVEAMTQTMCTSMNTEEATTQTENINSKKQNIHTQTEKIQDRTLVQNETALNMDIQETSVQEKPNKISEYIKNNNINELFKQYDKTRKIFEKALHHKLYNELCVDNSTVPKGLKIEVPCATIGADEDLKKEWDKILKQCSLQLQQANARHLTKLNNKVIKQLESIEKYTETQEQKQEWHKTQDRIENELKKLHWDLKTQREKKIIHLVTLKIQTENKYNTNKDVKKGQKNNSNTKNITPMNFQHHHLGHQQPPPPPNSQPYPAPHYPPPPNFPSHQLPPPSFQPAPHHPPPPNFPPHHPPLQASN